MNRTLLAIITFALLTSFTEPDNKIKQLDLSSSITKSAPSDFLLNSITTSDVEFIPIESGDEFIGEGIHISDICNDNYYITDVQSQSIYVVTKDGSIRSKIHKVGRGEGEYLNIRSVYADNNGETIELFESPTMGNDKHITYDINGKFIKQQRLSEKNIGDPIFHSNEYNITRSTIRDNKGYMLHITDNKFNIIGNIFPIKELKNAIIAMYGRMNFSHNKDIPILGHLSNDTLFTVAGGKVKPLVVIRLGKHRRPDNDGGELNLNLPYVQVLNISSTIHHYFISYILNKRFFFEVWQKSDSKIIGRFIKNTQGSGYPYKLPSGKIIKFAPTYVTNNEIYGLVQATVLAGELDGVTEEDNPVIIHLTIKR